MLDAQNVKKDFPIFSNHDDLYYFDSASTTQKPQAVIDSVSSFYSSSNANIHRALYKIGETATDGFTLLDLDIRRSITIGDNEEFVLSIFGRNLLDEKARSHTSFVKDEVPLAGRNFGIKVNFNF